MGHDTVYLCGRCKRYVMSTPPFTRASSLSTNIPTAISDLELVDRLSQGKVGLTYGR